MRAHNPHRRQGLRRAVAGVASLGGVVGLPFVIGGLRVWLVDDSSRGIPVLAVGTGIIVLSLLLLWWVGRSWKGAVAADAREARATGVPAVPFGAKPREHGVVLRPRAAVRVGPGLVVLLLLPTALGMAADGLPVPAAVVALGTLGLAVLWWWLRSYELCLDHSAVSRRRRPRWGLAWSGLHRVEHKPMGNRWYPNKPDDLILHGRVTTPSGRVRESVRIRCNLLAVSPEDFAALAERYSRAAAPSVDSKSRTWS